MDEWVTFDKMSQKSHSWKMGPINTWLLLRKIEKWITLEKSASHLEKMVTEKKMGYTCKNGSHLEKLETLGQNRTHLEKWVT